MSRLSVGLVCPYDLSLPGGVQAQVLGLAGYLSRRGDQPLVIGPGLPDSTDGVDLGRSFSLPGNRSRVPLVLDPRVGHRIRAAVAGLDLLHVHEPLMPMASWQAMGAGVTVVATFHADPAPWLRRLYRWGAPVVRRRLAGAARVSAVSRVAASALPPGAEVEVVPNGLDVESFRPVGERLPKRVAFVGRDEPRKGLEVLLRAWESVSSRHPDAELVVVGSRRDSVGTTWMGRVDEAGKRRALTSASILVGPHLGGESFGVVLVEGMAAGCAVVASDLPAFREVVPNARFFPAGDHQALARVLVELLSAPEEVRRMGEEAMRAARRFDWSTVGAAYRNLYLSALS